MADSGDNIWTKTVAITNAGEPGGDLGRLWRLARELIWAAPKLQPFSNGN
jgi:hypothetical protein